jgi:hypothetical protein
MQNEHFGGADREPRREGDGFLFFTLIIVVIGGVVVAALSALLGAL